MIYIIHVALRCFTFSSLIDIVVDKTPCAALPVTYFCLSYVIQTRSILMTGDTFISRMTTMLKANRLILQALAILFHISSTFAAINLTQFQRSFNVEMTSVFGGSCNRDIGGQEMLPKVLAALDDAWLLSSSALTIPPVQIDHRDQDLPSSMAFIRVRALLYMFFGIRIRSNGQFDIQSQSQRNYNDIMSDFDGVDALQSERLDPAGYGLPRFRCREDWYDFYVHLADETGAEDPNRPLAAEYFNERGPNGDYLPGLMFDYQSRMYFRGPNIDPEVSFCDAGGVSFAYATPLVTQPTPIYGITTCDDFFVLDSFEDIPMDDDGPISTSQSLIGTAGAVLLSEMLILQSRRGVTLQPRVIPDDSDWTSVDWSQWNFDPSDGQAFSLVDCINLGLAKPSYARLNAPSYVHFALCLAFPDLECSPQYQ